MNAFIDPKPSMEAFGYKHDDYDLALYGMVQEWKAARKS
jgi:hypothetical protein